MSSHNSPPTLALDNDFHIVQVEQTARQLSTHSWEYGTLAEALLELYNPDLSVFGSNPFPSGKLPQFNISDVKALTYVQPFIQIHSETLIDGDGASGDPCSLGVFAQLLGQQYANAANNQLQHILNDVPRFSNGAISHRESSTEAWADFIYMVPPFIAYQAIAAQQPQLLLEAVKQCASYREILRPAPQDGQVQPWRHIATTSGLIDGGYWSTSNGWAAAGMARVLATIQKWTTVVRSSLSADLLSSLQQAQHDLVQYIQEIIDSAMAGNVDDGSSLLRNYWQDNSWPGEVAGTTILTATVYRMAILVPEQFGSMYVQWADDRRVAVTGKIDGNTGIASPAINSLDWQDRNLLTTGTPEAQSFVILLYAAYRDYLQHK